MLEIPQKNSLYHTLFTESVLQPSPMAALTRTLMGKPNGGLQDIHMLLNRASRKLQQTGHHADGNPRIALDQGQDPITRLYRPFGLLKALRRFAAVLEPNAEVAESKIQAG